MPLDAQSFRDDLAAKSAEKRQARFEQFKKRKALERATKGKPSEAEALLAVKQALQALADLIVARGGEKSGPVTFTVTERGGDGKVIGFRVE